MIALWLWPSWFGDISLNTQLYLNKAGADYIDIHFLNFWSTNFFFNKTCLISGIIGGIANAFGNSIGLFMSQSAERGLQIHETTEHGLPTRIHSKMEVLTSSVLAFMATIVALIILLSPFAFLNMTDAVILTFSFGTILSFILGNYVGKLNRENPLKTGLKYAVLAIVGAMISHLVGDLPKLLI